MCLGWEIDYEFGTAGKVGVLYNQHIPDMQLFLTTCIVIHTEILREGLLELKGYPLAHHTYGVNRIY
jgi:hypothetical protein